MLSSRVCFRFVVLRCTSRCFRILPLSRSLAQRYRLRFWIRTQNLGSQFVLLTQTPKLVGRRSHLDRHLMTTAPFTVLFDATKGRNPKGRLGQQGTTKHRPQIQLRKLHKLDGSPLPTSCTAQLQGYVYGRIPGRIAVNLVGRCGNFEYIRTPIGESSHQERQFKINNRQ